jgi:cytochrome c-type biogenesis protein CcmE
VEGSRAEEATANPPPATKRVSRRTGRVAVVAVVIVIVLALVAFWGSKPQKTYTPSQVLADPQDLEGKSVQVRGLAASLSLTDNTFVLGDGVSNLTVRFTSLPDAFEVGKEMIVKGVLQRDGGYWILVAQDVAVGHPQP